jgi:hypothetical protein
MNKNLKVFFAGALAISLIVPLAGCVSNSPEALASIESTFTNEFSEGYLVGDELTIETDFTASEPVGGNLDLSVDVSVDDGNNWEQIYSDTVAGDELTQGIETKTVYAFEAPGTAQFRATVLNSGTVISEMESENVVISELTSLVRSLWYEYSQATESELRFRFIRENNFPGAFDMKSPEWKNSEQEQTEFYNYWDSWERTNAIPDLDSIAPDQSWELAGGKCDAAWNPPKDARFYIVTLKIDKQPQDVHVGYLDGRLYFFISVC